MREAKRDSLSLGSEVQRTWHSRRGRSSEKVPKAKVMQKEEGWVCVFTAGRQDLEDRFKDKEIDS